ncbi:hypothetical protein ACYT7O_10875, partial [Streptococcus pyogenes]
RTNKCKMGLLSDPSLGGTQNRLTIMLNNHCRKICMVFYLAGLVWFANLATPNISQKTYLSENALSPGLVYPEMKQDASRYA